MSQPATNPPRITATPWDALLPVPATTGPTVRTAQACLVINGRRCTCKADIYTAHGLMMARGSTPVSALPHSHLDHPGNDDDVASALAECRIDLKHFERVYFAARWQRRKTGEAEQARRAAWEAEHRDERRTYKQAYDQANADQVRKQKTEWAKKKRLVDPEPNRLAQRAYYERHKEACRARSRVYQQRKAAQARGELPVAAPAGEGA